MIKAENLVLSDQRASAEDRFNIGIEFNCGQPEVDSTLKTLPVYQFTAVFGCKITDICEDTARVKAARTISRALYIDTYQELMGLYFDLRDGKLGTSAGAAQAVKNIANRLILEDDWEWG